MDTVQRHTFQYFWEGGEPYSGMAREHYHIDNVYPAGGPEVVTSGGNGIGIMAILSSIEPGLCEPAGRARKNGQIVTFVEKANRFMGLILTGGMVRQAKYCLSVPKIMAVTWWKLLF